MLLDRVDQSRGSGRARRTTCRGVEARQRRRATLEDEPVHRTHQLQGRLPAHQRLRARRNAGRIEHLPYRPTPFGVLGGMVQQVAVEL